MSEYQYYEFIAVDKPLTRQQQSKLRQCSSRANITLNSFVNEYQWGDLKADPLDWLKRYFDAHLYYACWGSCRLMLRLPAGIIDNAMLDACCKQSDTGSDSIYLDAFDAKCYSTGVILEWSFNDDSGDYFSNWDEAQSEWMGMLLPLRDELRSGDTRPLYLGWLARRQAGDLGDNDLEPPIPAGLGELTPAQQALVRFLAIDPDWLTAAAQTSPQRLVTAPQLKEEWLQSQSESSLQDTVRLLMTGKVQQAEQSVHQAYRRWLATQQPATATPDRRSVSQIKSGLALARQQRLIREQQQAEALAAQAERERAAYLTQLAANPTQIVSKIEAALSKGSGVGYDLARDYTLELADALNHVGQTSEFEQLLKQLLRVHGKRRSWVARLTAAGITLPC